MNWGNWILVTFVSFALFVATLVTICVRQDAPLVTKEYYHDEITYQQQLERKQNGADLVAKPEIEVTDDQVLVVRYDESKKISSGSIRLFRPSDASLDQEFVLQSSSDSIQKFPLQNLKRGLYKARMSWSMEGKEYFIEKIIVL